jgi:hypothetical protein
VPRGLFTHMKSALLAAIFAIAGGGAILLAVPAEEKAPVVKFHTGKWAEDGPLVPQIEKEALVVPEPLEQYLVAQAKTKTEKQAPRRHRHVARPRPNFFEELVVGFIDLQKHQPVEKLVVGFSDLQKYQPAKSSRKRSRTTSRRG